MSDSYIWPLKESDARPVDQSLTPACQRAGKILNLRLSEPSVLVEGENDFLEAHLEKEGTCPCKELQAQVRFHH